MRHNDILDSGQTVDLHGLKLDFQSPDRLLRERFEAVYGHLPSAQASEADISVNWSIQPSALAPMPPSDISIITEGELVSYYGHGTLIYVRLPKYGLISVDLDKYHLTGVVTQACLEAYGVFEDVMMISLAPLYRRRGWFPVHGFAAQAPTGQATLISGEMGAGKTTTGLALLSAGWKLLSNDSPLLTMKGDKVHVLAYPGRLSAFDDSLARFDHLRQFIPIEPEPEATSRQKRVFRVEEAFHNPWASSARAGGIFFPKVVPGLQQSKLIEIEPKAALLQLIPQAIEGWDKETIGKNLQLLSFLVEQVPCYNLQLSPHVEELPALLASGLRDSK